MQRLRRNADGREYLARGRGRRRRIHSRKRDPPLGPRCRPPSRGTNDALQEAGSFRRRTRRVGASPQLTVLAGGVGAAKFLRGLIRSVDPADGSPSSSTRRMTIASSGSRSRRIWIRSPTRSRGWGHRAAVDGASPATGSASLEDPRPGYIPTQPDGSGSATPTWRRTSIAPIDYAAGATLSMVTREIGRAFGRRSRACCR